MVHFDDKEYFPKCTRIKEGFLQEMKTASSTLKHNIDKLYSRVYLYCQVTFTNKR